MVLTRWFTPWVLGMFYDPHPYPPTQKQPPRGYSRMVKTHFTYIFLVVQVCPVHVIFCCPPFPPRPLHPRLNFSKPSPSLPSFIHDANSFD